MATSAAAELDFLRRVVDATRFLIVVVDAEGLVIRVNRAFERATGHAREAWARPIWELAALPEERTRLRTTFCPPREQELPASVLIKLATSHGAWRIVDFDLHVLDGEPHGQEVMLVGVDLSEHMAAGRRVQETAVLQQLMLDALPAIVWTTDTELRVTFNAGGGLAAFGTSSNQIVAGGSSLYGYLQTRDPAHPVIAPHLRALAGESVPFEAGSGERLYQGRIGPFQDREGHILGCIGLIMDVTEQVRSAEALRDTALRLQRLMESDVIGIMFWEGAGRITEANNACLQLLDRTRDELLSGALSWRGLTPEEYRARDDRALAEIETTGKCVPFEKEFWTKTGERVPVMVGAASFNPPKSSAHAGVAFILDLREQVRLRKARDRLLIQEQHARLETQQANARLLLLVAGSKRLSRTMRMEDALDALAEVVVPGLGDWSYIIHRGWSGEPTQIASSLGDPSKRELLQRLHGFVPEHEAPEGAARVFRTGETACYSDVTLEQLSSSAPWPIVGTRDPERLHLIRELGTRSLLCVPIQGRERVDAVMLLASADPQRYAQHDIVLAQDLAARAAVSLENARLLAEALESVRVRDDFLAVAAHELRTPLTSLMLQVQVLQSAVEQGKLETATAQRNIRAAEAQTRRLSLLTDRLLDVARLASNRMVIHAEELDLMQLVQSALSALTEDLRRAGCAVELSAPAHIAGRWDRLRIEQVLVNLLSNAIKFGEGRPIEVTATATATTAQVAIRDHGIGISPEDQARIFGRFERAVSVRHFGGLGLGLYISAQILRAHRGSLRVESAPGRGALFVIELPRRPELAAPPPDVTT